MQRSQIRRANGALWQVPSPVKVKLAKLKLMQAKASSYAHAYVLRSVVQRDQTYIGSTSKLKERLAKHNADKSTLKSKFRPWPSALVRA